MFTPCQVPGDGTINRIHITDYGLEGEVPLEELCPLTRLVVSALPCRFEIDVLCLALPCCTDLSF